METPLYICLECLRIDPPEVGDVIEVVDQEFCNWQPENHN